MHSINKRRHRLVGIILILPFIAWSVTGIFFLIRPPYFEAYEQIPVKTYPLIETHSVDPNSEWLETRLVRSVLGQHLLIKDQQGWQHLHADTQQAWQLPNESELSSLLNDAFQFNPDRYGRIASLTGSQGVTNTGIQISVDWPTLSISQEGADRRWIDRIYSIHYLQWTGIAAIDRILGLAGLALLIYMTYTGARMAFGTSRALRLDQETTEIE